MIEVRNLSRYYGDFAAISNISFSIQRHEIVGFLGLNGVGKSTTLKILAGILSPSSGEVFIDSINWLQNPDSFRSKIGFLPEEPPLYKDMTVREFLHFTAGIRNFPHAQISERVEYVCQICQLSNRIDQVIDTLSLGYKKRVGIAQAIIHNPSLIILDEPTSGLDPHQMVELRQVIKTLSTEATVLLSSHNLTEVAETCDRLLILNDGKIIAEGNQESLSKNITQNKSSINLTLSNVSDPDKLFQTMFNIDDVSYKMNDNFVEASLSISCSIPNFIRDLVEHDVDIHKVTSATSELESIFLSLTGGSQ